MDEYKGEWRTPWEYTFPVTGGIPGDGGDLPSFWEMAWFELKWMMTDLHTFLLNLHHPCGADVDSNHDHPKEGWWGAIEGVVGDVDQRIHDLETVPASDMLALALSVIASVDKKLGSLDKSAVADIEASVCSMLEKFRAWLWDKYGCHVDDDVARRCLVMADVGTTCIIGLLRDQVRSKGIFSIDTYELSDWLTRHGANPLTLTCPMIRSLYDNIFAFENGDVEQAERRRRHVAALADAHGVHVQGAPHVQDERRNGRHHLHAVLPGAARRAASRSSSSSVCRISGSTPASRTSRRSR